VRQAIRIIHVLVAGQSAEHGLAELAQQGMSPVRARARVGQDFARDVAQAKGMVEFTKGKEPGIGRDL
jgi:hypothetical protein